MHEKTGLNARSKLIPKPGALEFVAVEGLADGSSSFRHIGSALALVGGLAIDAVDVHQLLSSLIINLPVLPADLWCWQKCVSSEKLQQCQDREQTANLQHQTSGTIPNQQSSKLNPYRCAHHIDRFRQIH